MSTLFPPPTLAGNSSERAIGRRKLGLRKARFQLGRQSRRQIRRKISITWHRRKVTMVKNFPNFVVFPASERTHTQKKTKQR